MKNFLRERTKTTENLTLIALLAAINAIFSLFAYFIPIGGLILMLLLPVTGVIFARCCKARFTPIYIIGSLGVSILVTFFDFASTILYVFPALVVGTIYGLISKGKTPTSISIFITSIINITFIVLSYLTISSFINIDILGGIKTILNLPEIAYEKYGLSILFIYSLSEIALSHIFVMILGEKMSFRENDNSCDKTIYFVVAIVMLFLSFGLSFESISLSIFMMFVSLFFSSLLGFKLVEESSLKMKIAIFVILGIGVLCIPILVSLKFLGESALSFLILPVSTILSYIVVQIYTINAQKKRT